MKKKLLLMICTLACNFVYGQGYNHQWLLGYDFFSTAFKGRAFIDTNSINIQSELRKMTFWGTQANICDASGNFLMSSNGIWIANANNDTMMNGSGLNPGGITPNWPYGLPMTANNVFIPYPNDTTKYILFHHSADTYNGVYSPVYNLFWSVIDMSLDNGLGGVIIKNDILLNDTINGGIGICKHANGRDWWVIVHKDSSDLVFKILIDNSGFATLTTQNLNYLPLPWGNFAQLTFSQQGDKFISTTYIPFLQSSYLVIADFDRCNGMFSNTQTIQLTSGTYLWGLAFSPSGKYIYSCTSNYIFQVDADNLTVDTVAVYDGFISPGPVCCPSTFWNMYLAADGKIYVTSGSGVHHLHVINYPDSAGTSCDVQQHVIDLINYYHLRAVPNHPNYYLGCDTTQTTCPCLTDINNLSPPDFKFRVYPNPVSDGLLNIGYLLPQNKSGVFEIYDVTGKVLFRYTLPPWSNYQSFKLPQLSDGIYQCVITSEGKRVGKKLAVIKE